MALCIPVNLMRLHQNVANSREGNPAGGLIVPFILLQLHLVLLIKDGRVLFLPVLQ